MSRGKIIADVIMRRYDKKPKEAPNQTPMEVVRNPTSADPNNPMGMPAHVPPSGDFNDPTGKGKGGVI